MASKEAIELLESLIEQIKESGDSKNMKEVSLNDKLTIAIGLINKLKKNSNDVKYKVYDSKKESTIVIIGENNTVSITIE
jgi:hypothetical protein